MRFASLFACAVLLWALGVAPTQAQGHAERRVALVIGNSAYQHVGPLPNPANDAAAMAALFKSAGFDAVELRSNLGGREMRRAIGDFSDAAAGSDIAVIYFAGHGMEVDGVNYMIPVDAVLERDLDVEGEAIPLETMLQAIEPARRLRLVILDACRNNPFVSKMKRKSRAIGRGLRPVAEVANTLVAYAAKAGSTAADGDGDHSPFTAALLKHVATPGLDIRLALGAVRDAVMDSTSQKQEPFVYGSLGGRTIAIAPAAATPPPSGGGAAAANPAPTPAVDAAAQAWAQVQNTNNGQVLDDFQRLFAGTIYASLAAARAEVLRSQQAAVTPPGSPQLPAAAAAACSERPVTAAAGAEPPPCPLSAARERSLKEGDDFRECEDCPDMVAVPSGTFIMGSPAGEPGREPYEGPQQKITIARMFAVSRSEISFTEWDACLADGGCNARHPGDNGWGHGSQPVIYVSWEDARSYVAWLSKQTGAHYRLLSEAEWEYAARGCRFESCPSTPFWFGAGISRDRANYDTRYSYDGSPKAQALRRTLAVDSGAENPFKLLNVHGNVREWVEDCWNPSLSGQPRDGAARATGDCRQHVLRGGSWADEPKDVRSAKRMWQEAGSAGRRAETGFRVARDLPNAQP